MTEDARNGRFQLDGPTKWLAGMMALVASTLVVWGTLGFPTPATKAELAANTTADNKFRLTYYNERRDQLLARRAGYQNKNEPVPDWLRRDITRTCEKIAEIKRRLNLAPTCGD